ncbi:MAG TPA: hypothetical protein VE684_12180 [Crenalkalicoccus sp.]|nr:hypothetical protein [Crenalkalicoccus sp.]
MDAAMALTSRRILLLASGGLAALAFARQDAIAQGPAAGAAPPAPSWPHVVQGPGGSATIYQPQVISWPGQTTLNARAALSITRSSGNGGGAAAARPVFGTVEIAARTTTDFATRTVQLSDLRLLSSRFPSLDTAQAAQLEARIREALPRVAYTHVPLDTILFSLRGRAEVPSDPAVNNDPPVILYSDRPASLVVFDGEPVLAPVGGGSPLSVAVNTNWDVFFDPASPGGSDGSWYLLNNGSWYAAPKATGPFAPVETLPEALRSLPDTPATAEARKAISGSSVPSGAAPRIFVSTKPAEIIITDGPPALTAIPGTQVQLVSNSNSALFRHAGDDKYYYLVSGRWFSAPSLDGPWTFATPDLPADFAAIPPDSPAGSVLPSVPGTAEAQEAVLQAQIPRTATLDRKTATLEVTYVGRPEFKPIPGTGIAYAVNTSFEVLEIGGKYYCCHQGAWFVAARPTGPWALADSVPPAVHRIPPSHPLHNVTYVNVYEATPAAVTFGYTAGYLGAMVTAGVLVYGTGYYYPPVVLPAPVPVYMPYPYTYAGNVWYNPTTGAWARGGTVYGPYGGVATGGRAYNPNTGAWAQGGAIYGPYGGAGAWSAYNPQTGAYAHGSAAWNQGGGWANASFVNPTTGRSGSTNQNWNPYGGWGSSTISGPNQTVNTASGSNARGSAGGFTSSTGAEGAGFRGAGGNQGGAVRTQGGNVYAGADGNVYRKTDDGWSKWNNGGWQPVNPPTRNTGAGGANQQGNLGSGQQGGSRGQGGSTAHASSAGEQAAARGGNRQGSAGRNGAGGGEAPGFGGGRGGEGGFGQLEQDHQARQFGEQRQRAFGGGGGWSGLESGGRFGGGGFGGFHRR